MTTLNGEEIKSIPEMPTGYFMKLGNVEYSAVDVIGWFVLFLAGLIAFIWICGKVGEYYDKKDSEKP